MDTMLLMSLNPLQFLTTARWYSFTVSWTDDEEMEFAHWTRLLPSQDTSTLGDAALAWTCHYSLYPCLHLPRHPAPSLRNDDEHFVLMAIQLALIRLKTDFCGGVPHAWAFSLHPSPDEPRQGDLGAVTCCAAPPYSIRPAFFRVPVSTPALIPRSRLHTHLLDGPKEDRALSLLLLLVSLIRDDATEGRVIELPESSAGTFPWVLLFLSVAISLLPRMPPQRSQCRPPKTSQQCTPYPTIRYDASWPETWRAQRRRGMSCTPALPSSDDASPHPCAIVIRPAPASDFFMIVGFFVGPSGTA
ncbi:hypothetical protein FB45DRAFT_1106827 [Roridomyces roridus]|uniref:Uncharacterized protein n=1 Tax=Roridomyces roridus TaxID=1738132 RepID=A0AAD7BBB6_9AGAR|nr:hypothetical protein FB45DRAFT_1106827 [Roridomyces roridus]